MCHCPPGYLDVNCSTRVLCAYWDESHASWSDVGVNTSEHARTAPPDIRGVERESVTFFGGDATTFCSINHLTDFTALMLQGFPDPPPPPPGEPPPASPSPPPSPAGPPIILLPPPQADAGIIIGVLTILLFFNWSSVAVHRRWVLLLRRGWDGDWKIIVTCGLCRRRKIEPEVSPQKPARSRFAFRKVNSRKVMPSPVTDGPDHPNLAGDRPAEPGPKKPVRWPTKGEKLEVNVAEKTAYTFSDPPDGTIVDVFARSFPRLSRFLVRAWQGARHDHTLVRLWAARENASGFMLSRLQALQLVSTSLVASLTTACVIMAIRHGWELPTSYNAVLTRPRGEYNGGIDPAKIEVGVAVWVGFLSSLGALVATVVAANTFRFVNLGKEEGALKKSHYDVSAADDDAAAAAAAAEANWREPKEGVLEEVLGPPPPVLIRDGAAIAIGASKANEVEIWQTSRGWLRGLSTQLGGLGGDVSIGLGGGGGVGGGGDGSGGEGLGGGGGVG